MSIAVFKRTFTNLIDSGSYDIVVYSVIICCQTSLLLASFAVLHMTNISRSTCYAYKGRFKTHLALRKVWRGCCGINFPLNDIVYANSKDLVANITYFHG